MDDNTGQSDVGQDNVGQADVGQGDVGQDSVGQGGIGQGDAGQGATDGNGADQASVGTGNPVHELSGPTVEAAVATAEDGSRVEGVHTLSDQEQSEQSRAERMADVPGLTDPSAEPTPIEPPD
jgi:hypothetical protein